MSYPGVSFLGHRERPSLGCGLKDSRRVRMAVVWHRAGCRLVVTENTTHCVTFHETIGSGNGIRQVPGRIRAAHVVIDYRPDQLLTRRSPVSHDLLFGIAQTIVIGNILETRGSGCSSVRVDSNITVASQAAGR